MMLSSDRRVDAGFSLFEVLASLFILSLIAGIAVVQFRNADRVSFNAEMRAVTATLRAAQQAAMSSGQEQVVTVDVDALRITHGTANRVLPDGFAITLTALEDAQTTSGAAGIRFYPDGISSGGRIALKFGQLENAVIVHWLGGRIAAENPK